MGSSPYFLNSIIIYSPSSCS